MVAVLADGARDHGFKSCCHDVNICKCAGATNDFSVCSWKWLFTTITPSLTHYSQSLQTYMKPNKKKKKIRVPLTEGSGYGQSWIKFIAMRCEEPLKQKLSGLLAAADHSEPHGSTVLGIISVVKLVDYFTHNILKLTTSAYQTLVSYKFIRTW